MRIAGIIRDSLVNGYGLRDVIFVQGCSHHCKGCHNPGTWDYEGGTYWTPGGIVRELSNSPNNITISGGEPLDQFDSLIRLLTIIKRDTKKNVWLYTGYTFSVDKYWVQQIDGLVDVVVDGEFVEEFHDPSLCFRGSSNQHLIDVTKSLDEGKTVEWEG